MKDPETDLLFDPDCFFHFKKFQEEAQLAGIQIAAVSVFRSFERQRIIWNEKFSGKRKLLDAHGDEIEASSDIGKRIEQILVWSTPPGLSRHHWGTEIDVFDGMALDHTDVQLTSRECEQGGPCYELHQWIDQQINLKKCQFYRPYQKDLGGIKPERWHLSYFPRAQQYEQRLDLDFLKKLYLTKEVLGSEVLIADLDFIFERIQKTAPVSSE